MDTRSAVTLIQWCVTMTTGRYRCLSIFCKKSFALFFSLLFFFWVKKIFFWQTETILFEERCAIEADADELKRIGRLDVDDKRRWRQFKQSSLFLLFCRKRWFEGEDGFKGCGANLSSSFAVSSFSLLQTFPLLVLRSPLSTLVAPVCWSRKSKCDLWYLRHNNNFLILSVQLCYYSWTQYCLFITLTLYHGVVIQS